MKLEIPIWPIGMVFAEGEGLMCKVGAKDMGFPETEGLKKIVDENDRKDREKRKAMGTEPAKHTVHTGGRWGTQLTLRMKQTS